MGHNPQAVLYVRVSSEEQAREGYSLTAQERDGEAYAKRLGFKIVRRWSGFESAKDVGRVKFNEMLDYVRRHREVEAVLIPKVDRMTRNLSDLAKMEDIVMRSDKAFHFFQEGFVYDKGAMPPDFIRLAFGGVIAAYESRNHRERVSRGLLEKVRQGSFHTLAPRGYTNDRSAPGGLRIDPDEAVWINRAFGLVATGLYSPERAREKLLAEGCPTQLLPWRSTIEKWIDNPAYYGYFKFRDVLYKGKFKPLVSKALWDRAHAAIKTRGKPLGAHRAFPYAGLMKCECGCAVVFEMKKRKYVYGHCSWYHGDCGNGYVREERIDDQLGTALAAFQISEKRAQWLTDEVNKDLDGLDGEEEAQRESIRHEIAKLDRFIQTAYEDRLEGKITEEFWRERTNRWQEERSRLESTLRLMEKANRQQQRWTLSRTLELAKNIRKLWNLALPEKKRELVGLALSNLVLSQGRLGYSYQTPFNYLAEANRTQKWWT